MYIVTDYGMIWTWMDFLRKIYKYFKLASLFILPLLHLLYAVHRYAVICCPHLITKFFTTTKSILAVIKIFLFGALISIHELFDEERVGLKSIFVQPEKYLHEKYTSAYIPLLLMVKGIIVLVASILLTKKMNAALNESIHFLWQQDATRHEPRIKSYQNIVRFNLSVVFLGVISIAINLTKQVASDLNHYFVGRIVGDFLMIVTIGVDFISIISCFEFVLFPFFVLFFLPHIKELKTRLSCCRSDTTSIGEGAAVAQRVNESAGN